MDTPDADTGGARADAGTRDEMHAGAVCRGMIYVDDRGNKWCGFLWYCCVGVGKDKTATASACVCVCAGPGLRGVLL